MATVGYLYEMYSTLIFERVSEGTARGIETAWRQRVKPRFGDTEIASITPLDVQLAFAEWSGKRSTKLDAVNCLSHIFMIAIDAGLVASNPCKGLRLRRVGEPNPVARALSYPEVERLFEFLNSDKVRPEYRRFVLALLFSGCRLGEVAGLRVSDVDLVAGTLSVSRTASAGRTGQIVIGETKGRRTRFVPISEQLLPVVLEAMEGKGEHEILFPGPRGGTLSSKNLSRALNWHEVRDSIKTFPQGELPLKWHDLRHTALTVLFLSGISAPDVQAIAGHSSLVVTQQYADTRKDAAVRAVPALSAWYESQSKGHVRGGELAAK